MSKDKEEVQKGFSSNLLISILLKDNKHSILNLKRIINTVSLSKQVEILNTSNYLGD